MCVGIKSPDKKIELVKEYSGDFLELGAAENYFRAIKDVPRLSARLGGLIFRRRFEVDMTEVAADLDGIRCAIKELRGSGRFRKLLEVHFLLYFTIIVAIENQD